MSSQELQPYLLAFGSNQRHYKFGLPRQVIIEAIRMLEGADIRILAAAPIISSAPIGPSARMFCNSCAVIETSLGPEQLLNVVKDLEHKFGRKPRGQPWRARVIDIDLILWGGGIWASENLLLPHPRFRDRSFVLGPASVIAPDWRDPISGLSTRQLYARLTKPPTLTRWAFRAPG